LESTILVTENYGYSILLLMRMYVCV